MRLAPRLLHGGPLFGQLNRGLRDSASEFPRFSHILNKRFDGIFGVGVGEKEERRVLSQTTSLVLDSIPDAITVLISKSRERNCSSMPSACYAYGDSTIILICYQQSVLLATYGSLSADAKVWPETSVLVGYTGPVSRFAPKTPREIDTQLEWPTLTHICLLLDCSKASHARLLCAV